MCEHFKECTKRFDKIDSSLDELNRRLFRGNGNTPWDVRLDRLEQQSKRITHARNVGIALLIAAGGKIIYDVLAHIL